MRNAETWVPTKYEIDDGRVRASRDPSMVMPSSRLIADLVAAFYGRTIPRYAKGRLLDLGCGSVPLYGVYRSHIEDATCIDWGASTHDSRYLDSVHDLNAPLPLSDASFQTVILSDVLEHILTPIELMKEIGRVLRPGGTLLLNVPFLYWLHELPHDYYRYTRYTIETFTKVAGLRVVELRSLGGVPEVMGDITAKLAGGLPLVGGLAAMVIQSGTGFFIRTSLGRTLSRLTMERFPIGYTLVAVRD